MKRFTDIAHGQLANDQQRVNFNNAVSAISQNHMNVRRRMIPEIHQDTAIGESLQGWHRP
ncbi:MAG: hypothetical protein A3F78_03090 [Burkholderiales bacterium RIFCSPLOWO2_12_FULL_61_40]|nr:MAG: hypothetical protein A3F78_03090 [Burkholderiales bacterium RIFCSPLOWO2_12_FULL_61_40]